MCAHYLFDADFCNVASGWEKGVVEKNVQDSRLCIWIEAREQRFGSFADLNAWLASRCRSLWEQVKHPDYRELSIADVFEQERAHLMNIHAQVFANRVARQAVAEHERLTDEGLVRYDWQHYIPLNQRKPGALRNGAPFLDMPGPLQRLRRALLRETGGERVMAKVLALVPESGLDPVLAVELALEQAPPSGRVSVEHVVNVLSRMRSVQMPPKIDTALQLTTPRLADTSRYDGLRPALQQPEAGHA